jgi:pyridoxine 5'-phosphate synthase PdxJ
MSLVGYPMTKRVSIQKLGRDLLTHLREDRKHVKEGL